MRSKRSWAWAGLGASSLLAFLTACGSVNESFTINVGSPDAGQDAAPSEDATVADAATDAASDATSDATIPDGSVQDAQVDAGVDAGLVVPDGGSVIMVGDAAVVIPPLDPSLLGDGGLRLSDGGLANADGGALTPRQFRDLVNGITCQRISECCCPGCSAAEQAQTISPTKCSAAFGSSGFRQILSGNEDIPDSRLVRDPRALAQCLALLNDSLTSCRSVSALKVASLRAICLTAITSSNTADSPCVGPADCPLGFVCRASDAGTPKCQSVLATDDRCLVTNDCTFRGVSGSPPNYCRTADGGATCVPYGTEGEVCAANVECGAGACAAGGDGVRRCSNALAFANLDPSDTSSFCNAASFKP